MVWAVYSLLTKKIGSFGWNVILTTRRIFFYGILFMIPASAFLPSGWSWGAGQRELRRMLLYLGLGACAMCFVTWNYAIKTLGPVKTMVYIYLVPVITVICSVLILHETVNILSGVGTALTLAGLILSQWDSLKALWEMKEEICRVPALKELFLSAADSAAIKEKAASVPGSETFLEMMDAYRKEYGFKAMYTHEFIYKTWYEDPTLPMRRSAAM